MTETTTKQRDSYASIGATLALFILVARILFIDFTERYAISVDDILAVALLIFGIRLLLTQSPAGQYIILAAILLSLANILQFNIIIGNESHTTHTTISLNGLSFNAFSGLLLVFYFFINWKAVKVDVKLLARGSESEQKKEREKLLEFYSDKFKNCSEDELKSALKMFKDYPLEAQQALEKIKKERNLV